MYCLAAAGRDGVTGRRMTAAAQAARAKLPMSVEPRVLVLNAGSLSVKFALYSTDLLPTLHLSGAVEGIGHSCGRFHTMDWTAHVAAEETRPVSNLEDAIKLVLTFVERRATGVVVGVGHRVVHGGPGCDGPKYVTPELEEQLRSGTRLHHCTCRTMWPALRPFARDGQSCGRLPASIPHFTKPYPSSRN